MAVWIIWDETWGGCKTVGWDCVSLRNVPQADEGWFICRRTQVSFTNCFPHQRQKEVFWTHSWNFFALGIRGFLAGDDLSGSESQRWMYLTISLLQTRVVSTRLLTHKQSAYCQSGIIIQVPATAKLSTSTWRDMFSSSHQAGQQEDSVVPKQEPGFSNIDGILSLWMEETVIGDSKLVSTKYFLFTCQQSYFQVTH